MSVLAINLFRTVPEEAEASRIMGGLTQLNHRDAAIIGASYLEQALEFAMRSRFSQDVSDAERTMIWGEAGSGISGILGNPAAKILIAHAVGLIGSQTKNDLWLIYSIRNVFTNRIDIEGFEHPLLRAQVRELTEVKSFAGLMKDIEGFESIEPSAFESFCLCVETLYKGLVCNDRNRVAS